MRSIPDPARPLVALTVAGALLLTAGCSGAAESIGEKATEKALESQTGGDVDIDASDGEVSIETEDGSMQLGSSEVPDEWPADAPLPDGLVVLSSYAGETADGAIVSITGSIADAEPADVVAEFQAALSGWETTSESTMGGAEGGLTMALFERDGAQLSVTATDDPELGTGVALTYTTVASS